MKMRGLRRKKKTDGDVLSSSSITTTPTRNSRSLSVTPSRKGFRRHVPSNVVLSPALRSLVVSDRTGRTQSKRIRSSLATEEEEEDEDALIMESESLTMFVTPEKFPMTDAPMLRQRQRHDWDRNSMVVTGGPGLIDCVVDWFDAAGSLVNSPEMQRFLQSSAHLALSAGSVAVQTAFLPVTVPLHVANKTTGWVVALCVVPIVNVSQLLLHSHATHSHHNQQRQSVREEEEDTNQRSKGEDHNSNNNNNIIVQAVRGVWGLPGHAFGLANHVKDELGGMVLRTLAPTLQATVQQSSHPGESTSEARNQSRVLERLRLDYPDSVVQDNTAKPIPCSHFLIRVDDLDVKDIEQGQLHYVDLGASQDEAVTSSLDRLVYVGLSLLANHPTVRLSHHPNVIPREHEIEWKPEGQTYKLLRRLSKLDTLGRLETLRTETLVWSGKFQHDTDSGYDRHSRFFLARGVLSFSPRALLDLLWDNDRTVDYNKFCLGRTTLMGNDLEFLRGDDKVGTKIIQSETRVPLTSISVTVKCLMHARALPDGNGYVIETGCCTTGPQGKHYDALHRTSRPKNEILWGVNILRRVPHRDDMVDLTSTSQVGTAGVPQFLTSKIALMGVEGFFESARRIALTTTNKLNK